MDKKTLEAIDNAIEEVCEEIHKVDTDHVIALTRELGVLLTARANLEH